MEKIVTYIRVSTKKQGDSGLGLEAQRAAVQDFATRQSATVLVEYLEVESGKPECGPGQLQQLVRIFSRERN
jgi:DNA invertase Pin-like site-specific DNA recombinase